MASKQDIEHDRKMIPDFEQVRSMIGNLPASQQFTDIRASSSYISLFRAAFQNLKFSDKKRILQCFYEQHGAPLWQAMDENLEANLTLAVNKICSQNKSKEYVQQLADEFCWFFMISLKFTWWHILKSVLRMPAVVPIIVEILRELEPVTSVHLNGTGPRLILVGVRRLQEEKQIENDEQEANWIRLVCGLMSDRSWLKKRKKSSAPVQPVVEKTEGVWTIILPLLESSPRLSMRTLLYVFDDGTEGRIQWSEKTNAEGELHGISAAKLFSTIVDLFVKSKKEGPSNNAVVAKLSLETLQLLVTIWKTDEVVFPADKIEWLERRFEILPWTTRCLVFGHLRKLANEMVQIPVSKCVMDILHLPENAYQCVDCDDWSKNHSKWVCSLTGLFQIASVSLETAENIMRVADVGELAEKVKTGQVNEPLMEALVRVLMEAQSLQEWRNCSDLFTSMFDRLEVEMGAQLEEALCVKSFSIGLRVVVPALKLCEAVSRMITKRPQAAGTYIRNFAIIANDSMVERVHSLTYPLAKFVAQESLFFYVCALASAVEQTPTEMGVLLLEIANGLKTELTQAHMDSYTMAASSIPQAELKEMLMKKLGIADEVRETGC